MRELCDFDLQLLCVNNYRGKDYGKPETCVDCVDCIFHPDNQGLKVNPKDMDKVISQSKPDTKLKKSKRIPSMLTDGEGAYYPDDSQNHENRKRGCGKKLDIPFDSDEPYSGCGSFKCGDGILCSNCSPSAETKSEEKDEN